MVSNGWFYKIWDIIGPTPASGLPGQLMTICLKATEMETTVITAGHDLSGKIILDIDAVGIAAKT